MAAGDGRLTVRARSEEERGGGEACRESMDSIKTEARDEFRTVVRQDVPGTRVARGPSRRTGWARVAGPCVPSRYRRSGGLGRASGREGAADGWRTSSCRRSDGWPRSFASMSDRSSSKRGRGTLAVSMKPACPVCPPGVPGHDELAWCVDRLALTGAQVRTERCWRSSGGSSSAVRSGSCLMVSDERPPWMLGRSCWVGGRRDDAADPGCGCCSEENPGGRPGRKSSEERTVTEPVAPAERCRWAWRLTLAPELALTWRGRNLLLERRRCETSSRERWYGLPMTKLAGS